MTPPLTADLLRALLNDATDQEATRQVLWDLALARGYVVPDRKDDERIPVEGTCIYADLMIARTAGRPPPPRFGRPTFSRWVAHLPPDRAVLELELECDLSEAEAFRRALREGGQIVVSVERPPDPANVSRIRQAW